MNVVNCTIADNTLGDPGSSDASGVVANWRMGTNYQKIPGTDKNQFFAPRGSITNCIFSGNRTGSGNAADAKINLETGECYEREYELVFSHNLCAASTYEIPAEVIQDNVLTGDAKFNGDFDQDYPPYDLRASSPAKGAGVVLGWMAGATDIAGNPRLTDNKVDLGCYQSLIPAVGMTIIVK